MESNPGSLFSLTIDPVTKANLTETAKWARFLAIVGMVVLVLATIATVWSMVVMGSVADMPLDSSYPVNTTFGDSLKIGVIVGTVVMLAVAFFPLLFLLRFANTMRSAIRDNDQQRLNASFQNLKIYFRYLGIVVLIVMVIYAVVIALVVMGAAAFSR